MKQLRNKYILESDNERYSLKTIVIGIIFLLVYIITVISITKGSNIPMKIITLSVSVLVYIFWSIMVVPDIKGVLKNRGELAQIESIIEEKGGITEEDVIRIVKGSYSSKKVDYVQEIVEEFNKDTDKALDRNRGGLKEEDLKVAKEIMRDVRVKVKEIESIYEESEEVNHIIGGRIKIIRDFERILLNNPKRIIETPKFINELLPELTRVVKEYNNIGRESLGQAEDSYIMGEFSKVTDILFKEIDNEYKSMRSKEVREFGNNIGTLIKKVENNK